MITFSFSEAPRLINAETCLLIITLNPSVVVQLL